MTSKYYIEKLELEKHPEGGWYREVYRAVGEVHLENMLTRNYSTAIYYLLEGSDFSGFHRIKSDEIWHFYDGFPINIYVLDEQKGLQILKLGLVEGALPQQIVSAGAWFAAEIDNKKAFALVGCTVAPGFDFKDFEMASQDTLLQHYPMHEPLIRSLTRY